MEARGQLLELHHEPTFQHRLSEETKVLRISLQRRSLHRQPAILMFAFSHILLCCPYSANLDQRDFYKSFGRPTAKVFLMAWATYQIIYWSWSKLDFMEDKEEKEGQHGPIDTSDQSPR